MGIHQTCQRAGHQGTHFAQPVVQSGGQDRDAQNRQTEDEGGFVLEGVAFEVHLGWHQTGSVGFVQPQRIQASRAAAHANRPDHGQQNFWNHHGDQQSELHHGGDRGQHRPHGGGRQKRGFTPGGLTHGQDGGGAGNETACKASQGHARPQAQRSFGHVAHGTDAHDGDHEAGQLVRVDGQKWTGVTVRAQRQKYHGRSQENDHVLEFLFGDDLVDEPVHLFASGKDGCQRNAHHRRQLWRCPCKCTQQANQQQSHFRGQARVAPP